MRQYDISSLGQQYNLTIAKPTQVPVIDWDGAQQLLFAAYSAEYRNIRDPASIKKILHLGDLAAFTADRLDLTHARTSVGLPVRESYTHENVAILTDDNTNVVGYGYVADTRSKKKLRQRLQGIPVKSSERVIREIAIHPDLQGQGLGRIVVNQLVNAPGLRHGQAVAAYIDEDNQSGITFFTDAGFNGEQPLLNTEFLHGIPSPPQTLRFTHDRVDELTATLSVYRPSYVEGPTEE